VYENSARYVPKRRGQLLSVVYQRLDQRWIATRGELPTSRLHHSKGGAQGKGSPSTTSSCSHGVSRDNKLGGVDLLLFPPSLPTTLHSPRTMSLPAASKQTTEKPAPGAVIEPVNKDDQAADIDRKVRPCPTTTVLAVRFNHLTRT